MKLMQIKLYYSTPAGGTRSTAPHLGGVSLPRGCLPSKYLEFRPIGFPGESMPERCLTRRIRSNCADFEPA